MDACDIGYRTVHLCHLRARQPQRGDVAALRMRPLIRRAHLPCTCMASSNHTHTTHTHTMHGPCKVHSGYVHRVSMVNAWCTRGVRVVYAWQARACTGLRGELGAIMPQQHRLLEHQPTAAPARACACTPTFPLSVSLRSGSALCPRCMWPCTPILCRCRVWPCTPHGK